MNSNDIHEILAGEDRIAPAPGFLASVMRAVEREATSRPPLAFPWARALPGLLAIAAAIAGVTWHGIGMLRDPAAVHALDEQFGRIAALAAGLELHWLVLAIAATGVALALSSYLTSTWNRPRARLAEPVH